VIYLDASADAPVLDEAWQAYAEASADFANPSSIHALGRAAHARLELARATIAAALGAEPDELVLTSGGTEGAAAALWGCLGATPGAHVVTSTIEHAAVGRTLERWAREGRIRLTRVAASRHGRVEVADVLAALEPETTLVSLVLACNETGALQPVAEVAAACRARGVSVHTDAVQAVGRVDLDCHALGVDALSLSGHKLGAVGGAGVLYWRGGHAPPLPLVVGGGQEHGRRSGTENIAGAASLAAALGARPDAAARARLGALRDRLEARLLALGAVEVIAAHGPRLCTTSCVRFAGCEGDGLMMALDLEGICVSTGSACSSGSVDPSPILLGMGLSPAEARQTLRFSLPVSVAEAEVDRAAEVVGRVVTRARALSAALP
jgi:cysteine desulfurase